MPLTGTAIRAVKPASKPLKLSDSGGLHLLVTPTGGKLWRVAYRFDGKQKQFAFGAYPTSRRRMPRQARRREGCPGGRRRSRRKGQGREAGEEGRYGEYLRADR
ncbi:Arm DNA-binding domain-containing protein [Ancylobacter terrae]|uniref:Arm DNA-binding domain-containing protein n=1 Tax=Ancylobacter sp. sgz301288 TaxID=3342077 RepID=UPI00385E7FE5